MRASRTSPTARAWWCASTIAGHSTATASSTSPTPRPTSSALSSRGAPASRSKPSPPRPYNPAFFPPGSMRFLLLVLAFAATAHAAAPPTPPPVTGRSWVVGDLSSGQILASQKPDERVEPASLTKLMTAYLVFAALREKKITLTQQVP